MRIYSVNIKKLITVLKTNVTRLKQSKKLLKSLKFVTLCKHSQGDTMNVKTTKDGLLVSNLVNFNLAQTLDCGQAFRWTKDLNDCWNGIVADKVLKIKQDNNGLLFYNTSQKDFENFWRDYFDLDRDYGKIIKDISCHPILKEATDMCGGIRILKQQPFETLCSFIISQNNNIPRIKGIIDRLCQNFGKEINGHYTFPDAITLSKLSLEDLAPLRSGFRAKYILDAAQKCANGEIDFDKIHTLPLDDARAELMKIKGVGPKVADCTLLFGFYKTDAFPQDVWIKRAMLKLFDGKLPDCALENAGIVQQYIFHYARTMDI